MESAVLLKFYCALLFIIIVIWTNVLCFNLEYRSPIVKRGQEGTYFGYSVALHKTYDNADIRSSWLLVGAPLGQNLQPETNRSGALYKCPINRVEIQNDCIQVETDGRRSADFQYDEVIAKTPVKLTPPGIDELKNEQWLGVNVRSQGPGGKVIVCAHRYIWSDNLEFNQHGLGLCYSLDNELEWEEQWEPCKGRPVQLEHQQFGYCQAGTSLALLRDGTALIGSPGPFTWRGTMFVLSITGDFLSRDKNVYLGPLNDKPEPINKYSYLGMSVAAGKFFHNEPVSYAAGAPRSQDHGQVYIFNKQPHESEMNISLIIDGEQFASNFGYELLAADFNKDGYDDLLVAAPFYFNDDQGGSVYIYYNLRSCIVNCKSDATLRGKLESRFGFSLANMGDINRDGYDDLAVGAPYEGDGAVYIYLGCKDGIMTTHSQKIHPEWGGIRTLGYSLSGGLDMDNNGYPDLLVGAYESDAVLLFRARPIIDIETEIIGKELKNIDMTSAGCEKDPNSSLKCFSFRACFTINSAESKTNLENVIVKCRIHEMLQKRISRVWFEKGDPNIKHNYQTKTFPLGKNQKRYCEEETIYISENTRDILSPIKFRINYTLANDLPHSAILNQTSVNDFEATFQKDCGLDDICQSEMIMSARLLLNETTTEKQYILNLGDLEEFHVEVNVTNKGDPAYEAKVFFVHPLSVRYIDILNKSRNFKCEKKNDTVVFCELGNPLQTDKSLTLQLRFETKDIADQSRSNVENELEFNVFVNSTSEEHSNQTRARLMALISRKSEIKLSSSYSTKTVVYSGEIKGESAMMTFNDVGSTVWHSYQIQQFGPMSYVDLQVTIAWPWQVGNNKPEGKWLLYLEDVRITEGREQDYCRVEPGNAINVLNLTRANTELPPPYLYQNGSSFKKIPDHSYDSSVSENSLLDSFKMESENSVENSSVRRKRSSEYVIPATTVTGKDGKTRKVVHMDCNRNTAKCIKILCVFPKFPKKRLSTILIKSRLWNSTFVEDYSKIDWVRIVSYGNVAILDSAVQQHEKSQPVYMIETNAYPDLSIQLESGVPLWIYILAAAAGLLLLVVLTFILWKVGFFKRNRIKDPTLSGNLTKQGEQETLLNK